MSTVSAVPTLLALSIVRDTVQTAMLLPAKPMRLSILVVQQFA